MATSAPSHLDDFRGGSSLATWLARIVSNEALGQLRRQRPTVDISEVEETLAANAGPFITTPPTPEQAIARREIRNAIEKAVDELPPYFRSVFMLRAIEQMTVEETASSLGIPSDTVKTRFHRANKLLRQPEGPFLAYDHAGTLVSTIYMIPLKDLDAQKGFPDLAAPGGKVDHVSISYNAGHPGVPEPHYHIILWHIPKKPRSSSLQSER